MEGLEGGCCTMQQSKLLAMLRATFWLKTCAMDLLHLMNYSIFDCFIFQCDLLQG